MFRLSLLLADRPLIGLISVIAATSLLSCGENEPTEPAINEPQLRAVSITIQPNASTLSIGEVAQLSAVARNEQGQQVSAVIEWSSANPEIASVGRSNGSVTGVAVGSTTVTASSQGLVATADIIVLEYHPASRILISSLDELILNLGESGIRVTATALDAWSRFTPAPVEWTSEDPSVATIGSADGLISAVGVGTTKLIATSGSARATIGIEVVPENFMMQWANSATASSEYQTNGAWSVAQATGAPNVTSCDDESNAWASEGPGLDWLELNYQTPVRPSEIRIHEVWVPGAIIKAEVKDLSGNYHTVYSAEAKLATSGCSLRTLTIPIANFSEPVSAVRLTLDQRVTGDWTEIDAVRLLGYRIDGGDPDPAWSPVVAPSPMGAFGDDIVIIFRRPGLILDPARPIDRGRLTGHDPVERFNVTT
jgi:hypothetical protein